MPLDARNNHFAFGLHVKLERRGDSDAAAQARVLLSRTRHRPPIRVPQLMRLRS